MRRALKYLGFFLLFLLILFIGLLIYIFSSDFSGWKDNITQRLSDELGRSVVINEFSMDFGGDVAIHLAGVTISGEGKGETPIQNLTLDRLDFRASLPSLVFSDHPLIHQFDVVNLNAEILQPAREKDGDKKGDDNGGKRLSGGGGDFMPIIRNMNIRNVNIMVFEQGMNGEARTPTQLTIDEASINAADEAAPHIVVVKGDLAGHVIDIGGQFGSVNSVFDDAERFDISLAGRLAIADLLLEGGIMDPIAMRGVDLNVKLSGTELTDFASLIGAKGLSPLGAWRVNGHLTGDDEDNMAFNDLDIALGTMANSHLHITGMVARSGMIKADIDMNLDLLVKPQTIQELMQVAQKFNPKMTNFPQLGENIALRASLKGETPNIAARDVSLHYGDEGNPLLKVSGRVGNLYPTNDLILNLGVDIPNGQALMPTLKGLGQEMAYYQIANMPALTLNADIEAGPIEKISIKDIVGSFGKSNLFGMMDIAFNDDKLEITSRLNSKMINISELASISGDAPTSAKIDDNKDEDDDDKRDRRKKDGDLEDIIEPLKVDVNYGIDVLDIYGLPLKDISLAFTIDEGEINLEALPLSIAGGNLALLLNGDAKEDPIAFDFDFNMTGINPALIAAPMAMPKGGAFDLTSKLSFEGLDGKSILSSLDGALDMHLKDSDLSQMEFGGFKMATLDQAGFKGMDLAKVGCFNMPIKVEDGVFKTNDGFLGSTNLLTMIDGGYDAVNDRLNLNIAPDLNNQKIPITVKGSISDPQISITQGAGGALMTMLFGGKEDQNWGKKVDEIRQDLPANHGCQSYLTNRRDTPPAIPTSQSNPLDKIEQQLEEKLGDDADAVKGLLKKLF